MSNPQETKENMAEAAPGAPARWTRPVRRRPDVARVQPPELPGGGKLLLWLGLGCGPFIIVMGVVGGLGVYGLVSLVKKSGVAEVFTGPPPVLPYGEGPGEVFDPENLP